MNLRAYAKINWYLRIIGKRPDNYHSLEMIMQHIDLYDDLYIEAMPSKELRLTVEGSDSLTRSDDNLALKAARLLQAQSRTEQGAHILLKKSIPVGAGLGGGSADAAAVLIGLNKLWNTNYSLPELQKIGLKIGADVPYCLEPRPALVTGIGEVVEPADLGDDAWLILIKPEASLATGKVFSGYQAWEDPVFKLNASLDAIRGGQYELLDRFGGNSLLSSAIDLLPEISHLILLLKENGAAYAQMSGSGSVVFGVFYTKDDALSAFQRINGLPFKILTKTLKTAEALSNAR